MYAVEFRTRIKNGIIEIPKEYWERLRLEARDNQVRVILLIPERIEEIGQAEVETDLIKHLLANPLHVPDFTPLSRDEAHERS